MRRHLIGTLPVVVILTLCVWLAHLTPTTPRAAYPQATPTPNPIVQWQSVLSTINSIQAQLASIQAQLGNQGAATTSGSAPLILTNDPIVGTTLNTLTCVNSNNNLVICPKGSTSGVQGICISNCGKTGQGTVQLVGPAGCQFDGSVTANDYAQISSSTNGYCADGGPSPPVNGPAIVGTIVSTTSLGAGVYKVNLTGPNVSGSSPVNAVLKQNNGTDFASPSTTFTNLGGGTAGKLTAPTVGGIVGFEPLEQIQPHTLPVVSGAVTCFGTAGTFPFNDYWKGPLSGANVSLSLPQASTCADGSVETFYVVQDAAHTFAVTPFAGDSIPISPAFTLGTSAGNVYIVQYLLDKANTRWITLNVGTYPVQAIPTSGGGTGSTLGASSAWSGMTGSIAASTTDFIALGQTGSDTVITSEANAQGIVPYAGIASNLYCSQVTAANTHLPVYTVRKNGVSQNLTCSVSNTGTTCNDTTAAHNFTFAAGDLLDVQIANPASANATGIATCGFVRNG